MIGKRGNYSIINLLLLYSNQIKMNYMYSKTTKITEPHLTVSFSKTGIRSCTGSLKKYPMRKKLFNLPHRRTSEVMEEENKYLIVGDSESRNLATIIFLKKK